MSYAGMVVTGQYKLLVQSEGKCCTVKERGGMQREGDDKTPAIASL